MKFTIDSDTLAKRVKLLSKVANSQTVPILNNLLFEVEDNKLKITGSDSENSLKTEIPLAVALGELQSKVCINCRTIADALNNIPQQPITINIENGMVSLKYQNGECNFSCIAADEYPATYNLTESESSILIPANMLVENVTRCIPFLGKEDLRPVLCCVLFDIKEENTVIVGCDGGTLMKNTLDIKCENPFSFCLPQKPATLLKQVFGNTSELTNIRTNGTYAEFKGNEWKLTCRLQEGRYPNYESVIPQNYENGAVVDKTAMVSALKRVQPMGNQASNLVKLYFNDGTVEISSNDIDFATSAKENIPCDYNGDSLAIGVKGSRLLEILELIPGKQVDIDVSESARPLLLSPVEKQENQQIFALQMPMLLVD